MTNQKVSVKFECTTCRAIFKCTFNEKDQNQVSCPECGRKKLKIKKKSTLLLNLSEQQQEAAANDYEKELKESLETGEELVTHERDPYHQPEESVKRVPVFECVHCLNKFDFDIKKGDPSCIKCGSTEVVSKLPVVKFVAIPDPVVLTKAERKKIKFIRNGYRNYIRVKQTSDSLLDLLHRCDISSKRMDLVKKQLNITLKEIEKTQDKKLKEYDKLINA